jgi:hypothetical protein
MPRLVAALVVALVVLAGCQAPTAGPAAEPTPNPEPEPTQGSLNADAAPPPETDRLGWEDGYWHNATLSVSADDGLNESEREAVVGRAKARVEVIRRLEFEGNVSISVITRAEYANQTTSGGGPSESRRTFENVKSEALLLVGERSDSVAVQRQNRGQNVLGYYSPSADSIVLVSESDTPRITSERTLAHELVHALQDQHFDLGGHDSTTEDGRNGRLGLVEGDASVVEKRYMDRCGEQWTCVDAPSADAESGSANGTSPGHMGLYLASIFPYVDGEVFVRHLQASDGWDSVNAAYGDTPATAKQVIYPARYPGDGPATVRIRRGADGDWQRVESSHGGDDRLGQALLSVMFMYTLYDDYNRTAAIDTRAALNVDDDGTVNASDPLNYALEPTDGWTGDRLRVYRRGDDTAYVLKTRWSNASEAREFAAGYRTLLAHWGGEGVGENRWVVDDDSQFADAFAVVVDGRTVTVVNAPSERALGGVYGPAAEGAT